MLDRLTWFRQASFMWRDDERTIYVDPWNTPEDSPPADVILVTHAHDDHYCRDDLERLSGDRTALVAPPDVARELSGHVTVVTPDESHEVLGVRFRTVPAYNTREEALRFHPRAKRWVGYVLELGAGSYYFAGDTDHAPELDEIRTDVAFVPVGGYYTMDVPEAAGLVRSIGPRLAVPMHFGYVVGSATDGERFREAAAPVAVEVMTPVDPFERA